MALWGRTEDGKAIVVLDADDVFHIEALGELEPLSLITGVSLPNVAAKINELINRQNQILDVLRRRG